MNSEDSSADSRRERRKAQGLVLIGLGVLGILWGVFHILNAVGGYEQKEFAYRKTDQQVRAIVHERFPGAVLRALVGLGLILAGGRIRATGFAGDDASS